MLINCLGIFVCVGIFRGIVSFEYQTFVKVKMIKILEKIYSKANKILLKIDILT